MNSRAGSVSVVQGNGPSKQQVSLMGIEFKARVLLELGAELISSDAVAFYELIKNSIDAGSPSVRISVDVAIQFSAYQSISRYLQQLDTQEFDIQSFYMKVCAGMESDAQENVRKKFLGALGRPKTIAEAIVALEEAYLCGTYIVISDIGHGMNAETLQKGYLTVGTPMRLLSKTRSTKANWSHQSKEVGPSLGEKGIGRLAAMRLGHYVHVQTSMKGGATGGDNSNWLNLELDWRPIFKDPNLDSSALDYAPEPGPPKQAAEDHGTVLTIRSLQSDWHIDKIDDLAATQLAKLSDPFASDFIHELLTIELQGKKVSLPEFENYKLEKADAICRARLQKVRESTCPNSGEKLELSIEVDYQHYPGACRLWKLSEEHLASCIKDPPGRRRKPKADEQLPNAEAVLDSLPSLGPFEMEFHWFNRGRIMREDPDTWANIKAFVTRWSGGLLVYRDGFRVYPYGSPSDDWLDLDRSALSGSAYKLNRSQIIGFLRISQEGNPALQDQTNREGFRDCPEKEALRRLLRHVIITHCRRFLEDTLKVNSIEPPEEVESLEKRVGDSESIATTKLYELQKRIPDEAEPINEIIFQLGEIRAAWERAKFTIANQESELEQYVHLAGVGLQVEFISHELSRVTADALRTLKDGEVLKDDSVRLGLEMQLKTLDKRIRVLDLLSIPGRQRKVIVDVESIVSILLEMHNAKIRRHGLDVSIQKISEKPFRARIEQGQFLQIIDNLFSNSFYWLVNRFDRTEKPQIKIILDPKERLITFADNGPGIPKDMEEDIFKPFVTTKPPGDGRGLGLFISRRLAEYNNATLSLTAKDEDGKYRKFQISLKNTKSS